jgi:hypothetical protein
MITVTIAFNTSVFHNIAQISNKSTSSTGNSLLDLGHWQKFRDRGLRFIKKD